MLHGFFFGFTFKTNLSIFKAETRERKLFWSQINQSRVLFFFSKLFLPLMRVLYEKLEHRPLWPAAYMYYIYWKKMSKHLSRYEKNIAC